MRYMAMFLVLALFLAGCQGAIDDDAGSMVGDDSMMEDSGNTLTNEMPVPGSDVDEMMIADDDELRGDTDDMMLEQPDVTFVLTGENFKFLMDGQESPELKVKVGDKVRIEFSATSGFHDWKVDEFNAATAQVKPEAGMTSVEFVADKAGTFEYYCSVGEHRSNGMFGNLVVEE